MYIIIDKSHFIVFFLHSNVTYNGVTDTDTDKYMLVVECIKEFQDSVLLLQQILHCWIFVCYFSAKEIIKKKSIEITVFNVLAW